MFMKNLVIYNKKKTLPAYVQNYHSIRMILYFKSGKIEYSNCLYSHPLTWKYYLKYRLTTLTQERNNILIKYIKKKRTRKKMSNKQFFFILTSLLSTFYVIHPISWINTFSLIKWSFLLLVTNLNKKKLFLDNHNNIYLKIITSNLYWEFVTRINLDG